MRPGTSLTTSAFYVLLSLSLQDRDGQEILKDVTMSSAGRVKMSAGTLDTTLRRLLGAGLIVEVAGSADYYRLTHQGRSALAAELERMEQALKVARTRPAR